MSKCLQRYTTKDLLEHNNIVLWTTLAYSTIVCSKIPFAIETFWTAQQFVSGTFFT